jgi:hypothetical protein
LRRRENFIIIEFKSNEEIRDYLIDYAGSFKEHDSNRFRNDNLKIKEVAQDKQQILSFEDKLWKKLDQESKTN